MVIAEYARSADAGSAARAATGGSPRTKRTLAELLKQTVTYFIEFSRIRQSGSYKKNRKCTAESRTLKSGTPRE